MRYFIVAAVIGYMFGRRTRDHNPPKFHQDGRAEYWWRAYHMGLSPEEGAAIRKAVGIPVADAIDPNDVRLYHFFTDPPTGPAPAEFAQAFEEAATKE